MNLESILFTTIVRPHRAANLDYQKPQDGIVSERLKQTMSKQCQEYANLQHEVQLALQALTDLTRAMLDAFHSPDPDPDRFTQLDTELEAMVGRKERMFGALRQHVKEHKCAGQR